MLHEGLLWKRSRFLHEWRERFVRLTAEGRLQSFKEKPGQGSTAVNTFDESVAGVAVDVSEFSYRPHGFIVAFSSGKVSFAASSAAVRREWLLALQRAGAKLGDLLLELQAQETATATGEAVASAAAAGEAATGEAVTVDGASGLAQDAAPGGAASKPHPDSTGASLPPPAKAKPPPPGKGKAPPPPPPKAKAKGAPKAAPKAQPKKASELPLVGKKVHVESAPGRIDAKALPSDLTEADVNYGGLVDVFGPRPQVSKAKAATQRMDVVNLLPAHQYQNIAIHLRKGVDTTALALALQRLAPDECTLEEEDAERLIQVLPSKDVLKKIAAYGSQPGEDEKRLRDVEQQLRPLAMLSRISERLRILRLSKSLNERLGIALSQMKMLQDACSALCTSTIFRNLLPVTRGVFAFVNFGEEPSPDGVRQVDVQTLWRLQETKAPHGRGPFPRYNMLHFCLQEILKFYPTLTIADLERELGVLPKAADLSLRRLQLQLDHLRKDLEFVQTEFYKHGKRYASPSEDSDEEPEEVPQPREPAAPSVGTALPHFAMVDQDDSGSEEASEAAGSSCSWRFRKGSDKGFLRRLLAEGIDALGFADQWMQGNAVLGRANLQAAVTLPDGGDHPPPGMLRRLRPSGEWRKYWCEVRASMLICYRVEEGGTNVLGTSYVVLPGAEIQPMDSMYSQGRESHCFEVRPRDGGKCESFSCDSVEEVWKWIGFLDAEAHRPGVGFLSFYKGGWHLLGSSWQRLFCVLETPRAVQPDSSVEARAAKPRLLGYARVRDCAEGHKPERAWDLESVMVRLFGEEGASEEARTLARVMPIGLELEDFETGRNLHFACDSIDELDLWKRAFDAAFGQEMQICVTSAGRTRPIHTLLASFRDGPAAEVDTGQLFDLFSETGTPADALRDRGAATSPDLRPPEEAAPPILSFRLNDGPGLRATASGPLSLLAAPSSGSFAAFSPDQASKAEGAGAAGPSAAGAHPSSSSSCVAGTHRLGAPPGRRAEDSRAADSQRGERHEAIAPREGVGTPSFAGAAASPGDASASEAATATSAEPPDALSRLKRLEEEMVEAEQLWGRTLNATEASFRSVLGTLGLKAPDDRLAQAAEQLMGSLGTFEKQVAIAWEELDKHGLTSASSDAHARTIVTPRAAKGARGSVVQRRLTAAAVDAPQPRHEGEPADAGAERPPGAPCEGDQPTGPGSPLLSEPPMPE